MIKAISIETKYIARTEKLAPRIAVYCLGKRKMYKWDSSVYVDDNHKLAMHAYIRDTRGVEFQYEIVSYSDTEHGFVFHMAAKVGG